MKYVGIDPGASGGIAVILPHEEYVAPLPQTESEVYDLLHTHLSPDPDDDTTTEVRVAIERVHAIPGIGSTSSSFTFGRNYGFVRGVLTSLSSLGVRWQDVPPQTWQRGLGIPKECQGQDRKRQLASIARQRFPMCRVTLKTCDALLIAEWLSQQPRP